MSVSGKMLPISWQHKTTPMPSLRKQQNLVWKRLHPKNMVALFQATFGHGYVPNKYFTSNVQSKSFLLRPEVIPPWHRVAHDRKPVRLYGIATSHPTGFGLTYADKVIFQLEEVMRTRKAMGMGGPIPPSSETYWFVEECFRKLNTSELLALHPKGVLRFVALFDQYQRSDVAQEDLIPVILAESVNEFFPNEMVVVLHHLLGVARRRCERRGNDPDGVEGMAHMVEYLNFGNFIEKLQVRLPRELKSLKRKKHHASAIALSAVIQEIAQGEILGSASRNPVSAENCSQRFVYHYYTCGFDEKYFQSVLSNNNLANDVNPLHFGILQRGLGLFIRPTIDVVIGSMETTVRLERAVAMMEALQQYFTVCLGSSDKTSKQQLQLAVESLSLLAQPHNVAALAALVDLMMSSSPKNPSPTTKETLKSKPQKTNRTEDAIVAVRKVRRVDMPAVWRESAHSDWDRLPYARRLWISLCSVYAQCVDLVLKHHPPVAEDVAWRWIQLCFFFQEPKLAPLMSSASMGGLEGNEALEKALEHAVVLGARLQPRLLPTPPLHSATSDAASQVQL